MIDPFPDLVLPTPSLHIPSSTLPDSQHTQPDQLDHTNQVAFDSPTHSDQVGSSDHTTKRSSRIINPPSYLKYFHCHLLSHDTSSHLSNTALYPLSSHLSYDLLSPSYKHFVLNVSSNDEPQFLHQAIKFSH